MAKGKGVTTNVVAGRKGAVVRQAAMPGPTNPGQPVAMRKALSKSKPNPFKGGKGL